MCVLVYAHCFYLSNREDLREIIEPRQEERLIHAGPRKVNEGDKLAGINATMPLLRELSMSDETL